MNREGGGLIAPTPVKVKLSKEDMKEASLMARGLCASNMPGSERIILACLAGCAFAKRLKGKGIIYNARWKPYALADAALWWKVGDVTGQVHAQAPSGACHIPQSTAQGVYPLDAKEYVFAQATAGSNEVFLLGFIRLKHLKAHGSISSSALARWLSIGTERLDPMNRLEAFLSEGSDDGTDTLPGE